MIGPYLIDSVTLEQYTGEDQWGTPSTRTSRTVLTRVEYLNQQVFDVNGALVMSAATVLMRPRTIIRTGFSTRAAATIAYEDLITVDGIDHTIIQIAKARDFRTRFLRVFLQ